MNSHQFRQLFPALNHTVWLDTPGAPPGAEPVVRALRDVATSWSDGNFDWQEWDYTPQHVRGQIAHVHKVAPHRVALMGSVSEAAATVASSLPPGRIAVLDNEYRSVLFPFNRMHSDRNPVDSVPVGAQDDRTAKVIEAINEDTVLVAVSEVLSSDGVRVDIDRIRGAAAAVGAKVFVDATQSFGVLDTDYAALGIDYVAVHGYKWMLCPRGAAWLVVRDDAIDDLNPLMPGWKSTELPHGYFGGPMNLASGAAKLDCSPAWFSWIGARAALSVVEKLDRTVINAHVTALAETFADQAQRIGYASPNIGNRSHITVLTFPPKPGFADRLAASGIKATANDERLRVGFHYFNTAEDRDHLLSFLADEYTATS
ncbi:aminotransferase class V-fold PLP-dependent enzyme [Rhodococcus sp. IEGM 1366]|uniref:aminotransferase class V-fold PLP-dependent enzyme n=1 Tax=Rhodococcus sp. IEGM 1366 TaxID=3082223 RepID=UPI0029530FE0|nr:aminotransferase class V-fold PLP-dependent enzyme [Rhodococcus sp. IEGM 1366]MDV8071475.1 aminotransferase class V-fold PLP-dependent enzyme [Rhodococcus sp. IEGM 1366]